MFALMVWELEEMFARFGAGLKKREATKVEKVKARWISEHL